MTKYFRSNGHLAPSGLYLAIYFFLFAAFLYWADAKKIELYHTMLLVTVIAGLLVAYSFAKVFRDRTVYFYFCVVYCVFHFGLAPIFLAPDLLFDADARFGLYWYWNLGAIYEAHRVALVFLLGLICSNLLPQLRQLRGSLSNIRTHNFEYVVANLSLVLATLTWAAMVILLGASNYTEFNEKNLTSSTGASWGFVHSAIDASFLLALTSGRAAVPILIYLLWGIWAFTLGLRGEVAFPFVIALGVLVSQNRIRISLWSLVAVACAFLALSAVVAVNRVGGDFEFADFFTAISFGLAELGGSLRPVYEVVTWVDIDGFRLGETYYAPLERTFLAVFPIGTRLPGEDDERLMNVLVSNRVGPIGFSIAAESYYNFGLLGAGIVGAAIGWLLINCGRLLMNGPRNMFAIALTIGIFDHIRQSFVTFYGTTIAVLLFSLVIVLAAKILSSTQIKPIAKSPLSVMPSSSTSKTSATPDASTRPLTQHHQSSSNYYERK